MPSITCEIGGGAHGNLMPEERDSRLLLVCTAPDCGFEQECPPRDITENPGFAFGLFNDYDSSTQKEIEQELQRLKNLENGFVAALTETQRSLRQIMTDRRRFQSQCSHPRFVMPDENQEIEPYSMCAVCNARFTPSGELIEVNLFDEFLSSIED